MTSTTSAATQQIGTVLGKMVEQGLIAAADDASLYAKDDAIRSNQGDASPWVVSFFDRGGFSALAFVRPAPPLQGILRDLTRDGAPVLPGSRGGPAPRSADILVVRAGSAAALEQALLDRNACLVRGTGPDGDEVSIATCSTLSLHDAIAKLDRFAQECRRRT